jgi:hypothetical protein
MPTPLPLATSLTRQFDHKKDAMYSTLTADLVAQHTQHLIAEAARYRHSHLARRRRWGPRSGRLSRLTRDPA